MNLLEALNAHQSPEFWTSTSSGPSSKCRTAESPTKLDLHTGQRHTRQRSDLPQVPTSHCRLPQHQKDGRIYLKGWKPVNHLTSGRVHPACPRDTNKKAEESSRGIERLSITCWTSTTCSSRVVSRESAVALSRIDGLGIYSVTVVHVDERHCNFKKLLAFKCTIPISCSGVAATMATTIVNQTCTGHRESKGIAFAQRWMTALSQAAAERSSRFLYGCVSQSSTSRPFSPSSDSWEGREARRRPHCRHRPQLEILAAASRD